MINNYHCNIWFYCLLNVNYFYKTNYLFCYTILVVHVFDGLSEYLIFLFVAQSSSPQVSEQEKEEVRSYEIICL